MREPRSARIARPRRARHTGGMSHRCNITDEGLTSSIVAGGYKTRRPASRVERRALCSDGERHRGGGHGQRYQTTMDVWRV
jgi:hypothetical protein